MLWWTSSSNSKVSRGQRGDSELLSYNQIREWAVSQLHESPTDTVLTTLLLRWINEGLGEIASAASWKWLEAQQELVLGGHGAGANTNLGVTYFPHYVHELLVVWPGGQGYREPIQIIGAWELDTLSPSAVAGVLADYLAVWGYYSVARDNPTTGTILVTASAGAAGQNAQCRIEGVDQNGQEAVETVTIGAGGNVTSTAQFAAGPDGVRRCYVIDSSITGAVAPGTITFARGGTTIETLNVTMGERIHEHIRTELQPSPTAGGANTYLVRYYKRIRPVLSTDDVVDIPFEFEDLLMCALSRRLAAFRGDMAQVMFHEQRFMKRIRDLKAWQNRRPGQMRRLRGLRTYGRPW